jgi:hypothetical protein
MAGDWYQTTFLLETLVMIAKGQDDNGMDLFFTGGKRELKNSNAESAFVKEMSKARPREGIHTDMRKKLPDLLENYLRAATTKKNANLRGRNLTLIILTDGIWAGMSDKDSVRRFFKGFIERLTKLLGNQENRSVSIEFIQFGNDPDATHRLRSLDENLGWDGIP